MTSMKERQCFIAFLELSFCIRVLLVSALAFFFCCHSASMEITRCQLVSELVDILFLLLPFWISAFGCHLFFGYKQCMKINSRYAV